MQFKKHLAVAALCGFTTVIPISALANPVPESAAQENYEALLRDGMERLVLHPSGAVESLNLAIKESPRSWEAWGYRALARERLGNYEGAIADYTKAMKLNPYPTTFMRNMLLGRGRAYVNTAKHRRATEDFTAVIETVPNAEQALPDEQALVITAYLSRGQSHEAMKSYKEAMRDYDRVIELNSLNILAYGLRSKLKEKLGDSKGAIADWERVSLLTPQKVGNFKDKECFIRPVTGVIVCHKSSV